MAALADLGLITIGYVGRQIAQSIVKGLIGRVWQQWRANHPAESLLYEHARLWGQKLHKQLDPRKCHECETVR